AARPRHRDLPRRLRRRRREFRLSQRPAGQHGQARRALRARYRRRPGRGNRYRVADASRGAEGNSLRRRVGRGHRNHSAPAQARRRVRAGTCDSPAGTADIRARRHGEAHRAASYRLTAPMRSMLPGPDTRREIGYQFATIGLGPVLIAQALRVRRDIVRLDEPPGARSGSEGAGAPLRLLIAGDSAAAGVGAHTQEEALSGQLVAQLRPSCRVHWKLVAQTGHTVRDAIGQLRALAPERFDVAVVSIGVNDATGRTRSATWIERQAALIELLKAKFGVAHILLSSLPPM